MVTLKCILSVSYKYWGVYSNCTSIISYVGDTKHTIIKQIFPKTVNFACFLSSTVCFFFKITFFKKNIYGIPSMVKQLGSRQGLILAHTACKVYLSVDSKRQIPPPTPPPNPPPPPPPKKKKKCSGTKLSLQLVCGIIWNNLSSFHKVIFLMKTSTSPIA